MADDELARARLKSQIDGAEEVLPLTTIEKLKGDNPGLDLRLYSSDGFTAVFRTPSYGEWKRFRSMFLSDAKRPDALETLCFGCLAYPSPEEFRAMLQKKPGLSERWGTKLVAAAHPEQEDIEKKL